MAKASQRKKSAVNQSSKCIPSKPINEAETEAARLARISKNNQKSSMPAKLLVGGEISIARKPSKLVKPLRLTQKPAYVLAARKMKVVVTAATVARSLTSL